ncbi:MAG: 23S rRNA (cytosine1962-C5)-methyltransferase [Sphingobacteriales bacterium]|jgi:23S rRNA (cytosine1962-C5)-methyltransferase
MENLLLTQFWKDYELIDFGKGRKLERFGSMIIDRPEPYAITKPKYSGQDWEKRRNLKFISGTNSEGTWENTKGVTTWNITANNTTKVELFLSKFKHLGIFPEQKVNWELAKNFLTEFEGNKNVLNLFAYTGIASSILAQHAQQLTHVEAFKQIMTSAKKNAELNNLENIRWILDDAFKFIGKELKRGNTYSLIILDPPSFGRGPKGERWKIEELFKEIVQNVIRLLEPGGKIILNTYSKSVDDAFIYSAIGNPKNITSTVNNLGIHCRAKDENLVLGKTTIIDKIHG